MQNVSFKIHSKIGSSLGLNLAAEGALAATSTSTFNFDTTTLELFDSMYYSNLFSGKGVLQSNQILFESWTTKLPTMFNILSTSSFASSFVDSMLTMRKIEVKMDAEGEIHRHCHVVNPTAEAPTPVVTPSA